MFGVDSLSIDAFRYRRRFKNKISLVEGALVFMPGVLALKLDSDYSNPYSLPEPLI